MALKEAFLLRCSICWDLQAIALTALTLSILRTVLCSLGNALHERHF